ncbi:MULTISPECIES: hypothetical protein [Acinetobacter]|uniref:hypothetical protein n=1 Tax=Acinetobacter TaxID=469 RepID=UPI0004492765|nr:MULTISPECIES: hypothetical protein [Acinetobacter]EXD36110.1 hypothetical protein J500_1468 [Acinetobacter sp. 479375]MCH2016767.1 hypothetical protein [Acinetobacter ursingii]MCU4522200.1 hypothetical protein [Acinetobacter ursingii]
MLRLIAISGLCLGLMTGCATTTKLMSLGGGESPMQQVLKAQPEISKEHQNTSIQQVFNRVESPTVSRITVIQTGLMDDSVSAIKTEYLFKLDDKKWQLQNKQQSYQCARGKNTRSFQSQLCS